MGYQIIAESDGKTFALFSSYVDSFVMRNLSASDLIDYFVEIETTRIADRITDVILKLQNGEKPYHQFTMTLQEAHDLAMEHGGCSTCGIAHPLDIGCGDAVLEWGSPND